MTKAKRTLMNLVVRPAAADEQPIIAELLQLYLKEFATFTTVDRDASGHYPYPYLSHYWQDPQRFPFLMVNNHVILGLALVRLETDPLNGYQQMDMAEFFILPTHRRQGLGRLAAETLFGLFPGPWLVRLLLSNVAAEPFWRACIKACTQGQFKEVRDTSTRVFSFQFPI